MRDSKVNVAVTAKEIKKLHDNNSDYWLNQKKEMGLDVCAIYFFTISVFNYRPPMTPPDSVTVLVEVAVHEPVTAEVPPAVLQFWGCSVVVGTLMPLLDPEFSLSANAE